MVTCLECQLFRFLYIFFLVFISFFLCNFDLKILSTINQKNVNFGAQWQDEPKRTIRSFKEPKSCMFKNLKKPHVFEGFWVRRPPMRASRDPRRLSRGTQRAPKPPKKVQKVIKKLVKNDTKNDQKVPKKLGPKRVQKLKKSL